MSLKKQNKASIEEAIKKLVKSGKLKPLKIDQVCHADYTVPRKKYRITKHK